MPYSRDRLMRAVDIAQVFSRTRSGTLGIISDESRELLVSPLRQRSPMGIGGGRRRNSSFGTPGSGIRQGGSLYQSLAMGRENTPLTGRARGRGTGSVLPSWYPRAPLNDITAVLRAIERRRARTGGREGIPIETPIIVEDEVDVNSNVPSGVQLEHNFSTPASTARLKKPCPPSVHNVSNILLSVTNMDAEESELLTPQKKLLNSIDTVGKALMEELQKLKRTPSAKKAERQKKVRTLMSIR
ncbi:ras-related protein RABA4d-like [Hibiscus syriacus]|uniref:Ras-related protein RABA4d-like n=1 Tax=Hibiscus syriacus TaxID=106335 RepID=A0A6A2ZEH6_HIBSY|nr:protein POLYCHOME-like [Hibiscus syriacus]KAE8689996.1 ras-related protein RABA4d-like [Hibiscus syriacus]